jgi:hypothetical protein
MSRTKQAAAAATPRGAVAVAALEPFILTAVACTGGWVGSNAPGVPSGWAGALGGVLGLGLAAGVMQLLNWLKTSLRERTRTSYSPAAERSMGEPKEALPSHPHDVMDFLADAAQAGAAYEAAFYSGKVDPRRRTAGQEGAVDGLRQHQRPIPPR